MPFDQKITTTYIPTANFDQYGEKIGEITLYDEMYRIIT